MSWISETNDILLIYNLPLIEELLADLPGKVFWKATVKTYIGEFWRSNTAEEICSKPPLTYLQLDPELLNSTHPCGMLLSMKLEYPTKPKPEQEVTYHFFQFHHNSAYIQVQFYQPALPASFAT